VQVDLGTLSARYHQAFNDRDFDVWREVFDENVELVVDGMPFRGVDAAVAYGVGSVTQFPGLYIESERLIAESGDTVVTEISLVNGDPASGHYRQQGTTCEIIRVRDGRIVSCRSYYMAEAGDSEDAVRVPARGEAARIAEEQAALRRVATLVARGVSQDALFAAVNQEVGWLVGADPTSLMRFEPDDTVTLVAAWSARHADVPIGASHPVDEELRSIRDTGRPLRWGPAELPHTGPFVEDARRLGIRTAVGVPIVVDGRVWGIAFASSTADQPFADDAEARIAAFTELVATAIANAQARSELRTLVEEQAALGRVATLVAQGVASKPLFLAVTEEVGKLLDADLAGMIRYVSGETVTAVATWAAEGEHPEVRGLWSLEGDRLATTILNTGRPAREDDWSKVDGPIAGLIREQLGIRSSVGSPIVVEGRVWGALLVHLKPNQVFSRDTESRLASFTELVATAISNAQARTDVRRLAEEQAALRRVATLVARESSPDEIFAAVAEEVGRLLDVGDARMVRFEGDETATVVASWGELAGALPVGTHVSLEGDSAIALVFRTGRSARIDDFTNATGAFAASLRRLGVHSAVGAPIVVDGRLWGAMNTTSLTPEPIPAGTEARMREFTELVATAISNIKARSDLAASRARVVAAADEERRRVVRDLHDGAQQRLVHMMITLKLMRQALERGGGDAAALVTDAIDQAEQATTELRELVHGILPGVLMHGGLGAAVDALAARMPVPTAIDVSVGRLPAAIEATAYFVAAEALTNVAKHARAARAAVAATIEDGVLEVAVSDDGVGGADSEGSGLLGLRDRLAVLDGRLRVESPPGNGTLVAADIPLRRGAAAPPRVTPIG
jgi:signal transduction histidine kinase/ketosteroid isomerase-like protein